MSDIRLVMIGAVIIFAGFMVGGIKGAYYSQFIVQSEQFDECFDYSTGTEIKVKCSDILQDSYVYMAISIGLIAFGGFILYKGIKGKWDQNIKSDEMLGPKNP